MEDFGTADPLGSFLQSATTSVVTATHQHYLQPHGGLVGDLVQTVDALAEAHGGAGREPTEMTSLRVGKAEEDEGGTDAAAALSHLSLGSPVRTAPPQQYDFRLLDHRFHTTNPSSSGNLDLLSSVTSGDEDEDAAAPRPPQCWNNDAWVAGHLASTWPSLAPVWARLTHPSITTRLTAYEQQNIKAQQLQATKEALCDNPMLMAIGESLVSEAVCAVLAREDAARAASRPTAIPGDGVLLKLRLCIREMVHLQIDGALIENQAWRRQAAQMLERMTLSAVQAGVESIRQGRR